MTAPAAGLGCRCGGHWPLDLLPLSQRAHAARGDVHIHDDDARLGTRGDADIGVTLGLLPPVGIVPESVVASLHPSGVSGCLALLVQSTFSQVQPPSTNVWQGRQMIQDQPKIWLRVKDSEGWFGPEFPEDVDELSFQVVGVIKDVERLKALFDLFAAVLDQLCRIGSAYKQEPGITL